MKYWQKSEKETLGGKPTKILKKDKNWKRKPELRESSLVSGVESIE